MVTFHVPGSRFPVRVPGRRFFVIGALAFAYWGVGIAIASAMVVLPADFADMVTLSQVIVHGQVIDVRPQTTGGRRTIESIVTVAVVESLKGEPGPTIVFRVPGGQIGRYRRVMVGAPEFSRGDQVVLFLRGRTPAIPIPFGLTQGVYRVTRGSDGREIVTPLVAQDAGRVVRGDPGRRPLAIEAFAEHVRALVARQL